MIRQLGLLVFIFCFSLNVVAQQHNEEKAIEEVISTLFKGMKDKNQQLIEMSFHRDAIMHTVSQSDEGTKLGSNSVKDFINRIAVTPAETVLDERILSYNIQVDGDMASAWTPYRFYVNDGFSHCGVNSFQLIKINGKWQITYVIDTRRKVDCD
ncbi:MAG TPA: nuclear transport factor 2 family protein [Anditalea sp.]|nr:nuclear transport factor 2 family protein [Anditalea sp.]